MGVEAGTKSFSTRAGWDRVCRAGLPSAGLPIANAGDSSGSDQPIASAGLGIRAQADCKELRTLESSRHAGTQRGSRRIRNPTSTLAQILLTKKAASRLGDDL